LQRAWDLLDRLPRARIAHLPTPLEEAPRLREALGPNAPRIFIKRDDLTGLAFGGNKVRNLEFRMAEVINSGADTVVMAVDILSNSARQTTAVANRLGYRSEAAFSRAFKRVIGVSPGASRRSAGEQDRALVGAGG
jgi:D-cysteine desulfhydrase/L-cysteate sulfo-lyase